MTGKDEGTARQPAFWLFTSVLSCFALLFFGGCTGSTRTSETGGTGEKTEADLLAELDRKFENPDVHCELGRLYHRSRQWEKAEYHYHIALGFDPAHRAAQAGIVKMLADRGDAAKSEHYARNYIDQTARSVRESLRLGQEFDAQGLDSYALTCFNQALGLAPDSAEVNKQLGFYYLNNGDRVRAKEYLSRSFELDPNQPDVSGALGRLGVVVRVPRELEDVEKQ